MYGEKILVKEYQKLAGQFNPVKFDSKDWVRLASRTLEH
jgi:alpha-L-fucosidase